MTPSTTYADARAWYKKYEGELHRLQAIHGGWSRDIAEQARAFADGVPYRSPEEKAAVSDGATAESHVSEFSWDEILAERKPQVDCGKLESAPTTDKNKDPFDWDAAFGPRRKRY